MRLPSPQEDFMCQERNPFYVEDLVSICHCRPKIKKKFLMENCVYAERYLKDERECQRETCRLLDTHYTFTASILLFSFKIKNVSELLKKRFFFILAGRVK